eukprot:XP_025014014.1 uncharacterized protein LOC112535609 isoform X2 [Ricinus communis]
MHCPSLETIVLKEVKQKRYNSRYAFPRKYRIKIDCLSLKSLGVFYCDFDELDLTVVSPSLMDLQFSKCNINGRFDFSIVAKQLQTLRVDMFLKFFYAPDATFTIDSGNLKSLQHVSLSLGDNLQEKFITKGLVQLSERISYAKILELDFLIIQPSVVENIAPVNPRHLAVIVDQLQDYHITVIASFLDRLDLDSLKTLTIRRKESRTEFTEFEVRSSVLLTFVSFYQYIPKFKEYMFSAWCSLSNR